MLAVSELLCCAAIAAVLDRKYRRNARKSRQWTKKWLLKRRGYSHVNLLNELRFHPKDWHNFLRMNESYFIINGNLHLSLICYNNLSILLSISILLVGRVQ
jgi:hypothetical protein